MSSVEIERLQIIEIDYGVKPTYEMLFGGWLDGLSPYFSLPECREELAPERMTTTPSEGRFTVHFGCLHLKKDLTDNQILNLMNKKRVLPATAREAMDFGRQVYRGQEFAHPLIARGSSYQPCNRTSYGTLLRRYRQTASGKKIYRVFDFSHDVNLVWIPPTHFLVLLKRPRRIA